MHVYMVPIFSILYYLDAKLDLLLDKPNYGTYTAKQEIQIKAYFIELIILAISTGRLNKLRPEVKESM